MEGTPPRIILFHRGNKRDSECQSLSDKEQGVIGLGLLSLYAYLKEKGRHVTLHNLSNMDAGDVGVILERERPDVVGGSCYTFNRFSVLEVLDIAKKLNPRVTTVLGGPHASHMAEQMLESYDYLDGVVIGEGEVTFNTFLDALEKGRPWRDVQGMAFREQARVVRTPRREPIHDLDSLPMPSKYTDTDRIITSRGCPGRCIFCCTPELWGTRLRTRSAERVVDELEVIAQRDPKFIKIMDDTFTARKDRVIEICKGILDRGLKIRWSCNSKVSFICDERLYWMTRAGCFRISYGVESGSPEMLEVLRKNATREQIIQAAELTRKYGIWLRQYYIVGTPGETDRTVQDSTDAIHQSKPLSIISYVFSFYPGTQAFRNLVERGDLTDEVWLNPDVQLIVNTFDHTKEDIERFRNRINSFYDDHSHEYGYDPEFVEKLTADHPDWDRTFINALITRRNQV